MSSSETTPDRTPQPRTIIPDINVPDPTADEIDLAGQSWVMATVIEDDDLMFGGKPLCDWYEEDRRALSSCIDEEQTRGRPRERAHIESHHHDKAHHHHQVKHERKVNERAASCPARD
ncbi:uncharacterized protein B0T15DRAFT_511982 [Chaetomium strumarium]|uniref:Uncharacterized protein n=1 Tax=Chaetomium strumarium TaxID=1170767 RepID=A0AAJ0M247_9PEZI|nr:hypothetical protein B0T15DRAFT_511982 [Chaetomium strumarium]